jgi:hypothetical protein
MNLMVKSGVTAEGAAPFDPKKLGQIVFVLQRRTRMHVVHLVAPPLAGEDHSKDIDFSASGIRLRWDAGCTDTVKMVAQAPWASEVDPLEGFILRETEARRMKAG